MIIISSRTKRVRVDPTLPGPGPGNGRLGRVGKRLNFRAIHTTCPETDIRAARIRAPSSSTNHEYPYAEGTDRGARNILTRASVSESTTMLMERPGDLDGQTDGRSNSPPWTLKIRGSIATYVGHRERER